MPPKRLSCSRKTSEGQQIAHRRAQRVGDATQVVDAHADPACFNAPDVGLAAADHKGKLALGQALLVAHLANALPEGLSFLLDVHGESICATINESTSNMKP